MFKILRGIFNDMMEMSPILIILAVVGAFILGSHSSPAGVPLDGWMIWYTIGITVLAIVFSVISAILNRWEK